MPNNAGNGKKSWMDVINKINSCNQDYEIAEFISTEVGKQFLPTHHSYNTLKITKKK